MTWFVLVVFIFKHGAVTAEFYGEERCKAALADLQAQHTLIGGCYEKQK